MRLPFVIGMSSSFSLLLSTLTVSFAGVVHRPHDVPCSTLVVFGDSLSDDGIEAETDDSSRIAHGFVRNSNGPVWPEYLQKALGCQRYFNYAYSGARSGSGNFYFANWSGVSWQVDRFVSDAQNMPADTIVILQSGGVADFFTGENSSDIVVSNIHHSLLKLFDALDSGTIFLLNLVDPTSAPGMQTTEKSEDIANRIAPLVSETNRLLTHMIYDPELGLHKRGLKTNVKLIDLNSIAYRAMVNMNTNEPFTHHNAETKPRSTSTYGYHDLWHPSTFVHYKFSSVLLRELQDL